MRNKNHTLSHSLFILFFVFSISPVHAANAGYVLPYPSYMPGNKLYRVSRMIDAVKKYWHWGSLASYRYELGQSDKALVEAKTLFEYGQYVLALDALARSDDALQSVPVLLRRATREGKNVERYTREVVNAMDAHNLLLAKIIVNTPEEFVWSPEKRDPQTLYIHTRLTESQRKRREIITKLP